LHRRQAWKAQPAGLQDQPPLSRHVYGLQELPDGRIRATLRTPAPVWVRRFALRLGPQARVVAPAELATRVREDARRALAAYG
jgi:predicted DNA-binding transcriptional regulator YafY